MADIVGPDQSSQTLNADIYWHYSGDPVQRSQLLGTFNIGAPQKALLPIPADADIILRAVPRGARGQTFMAGPADADPVTIHVPGLGTGGGTSNYYQQLRVNHGYSYGTAPTPRPALNLLQAFQIKDDSVYGESDLTTFGVPTGMLNAKTDFNASGQIAVTTGSITSGTNTLVLAATLELQPGMGVYVAGAGTGGAAFVTTVTAVSADGKTLTLASNAGTTVVSAMTQCDDTAAIQAWINAKGDLWLPPGYYRMTSSIVLPTTSEGFSIIIHGSGWDTTVLAWQHGGDGFIPTSDLKIDSFTLMDLTVGTGTIGDTGGTIDANSKGIGIRMTAPSYTGIYNNFVMQRCRVIGWGCWGMWSDNLEVSWVNECIFRENKSGHVAWVGPDQVSPNKQPNANTLTNSTCDQGIGVNDTKRTISGSMSSGSRTLTGSGFTSAERGKFVIVHGAATNNSDLFTFIDAYVSSTQVTLAHQAQWNVSGTSVELFQTNVASILLNRANDTVIDGSTIQGNFVGCSASTDINAIKVYNSANLRIVGVHEEDNAGFGGAAVRMEGCQSVCIENWGGTSAGAGLSNAHNADFQLVNCHSLRVAQSFFNDRPQFVIDSSSSEVEIDNSFVVGWINLWQQDNSWDKLRVGSGVRVYQSADPRTNQACGNEYIYDGGFGRDLLLNGRFIDTPSLTGWTTINPTWWSLTTSSLFRGGTYIKSNSTAIADSGGVPSTIFHQAVAIPDSLPAGGFTLGFDWYIESQAGSSSVSGRYTEIRAHPSTGIDEAMQWSVRPFTYVTGVWQTAQIKCWLGSGTGRTIDVQINVTPGPNNVIIRFANFRLAAGKHTFGSWERAVHDFGGRMRAPIEFEPINTTTYPPPPSGSAIITLINDAGSLKLGAGGAYATLSTGAAAAGHTIKDEGTTLPTELFLNFTGGGVTAADDAPNTATKVTIWTATTTQEGCVSTGTQTFAGRKTFNNGLQSIDGVGVPIVAQYTGATSNAHIQDWWITGTFPIAYIDTQPTLRIGAPSGSGGRDGYIELANASTTATVKLTAYNTTANQTLVFPAVAPTSAGQNLQVQSVASGIVVLQWAAAAASSGHTIAEEGGALIQRTVLNFVGQGITAADDPSAVPTPATKVTLNAATVSTEGIVSTATQTFGGRKTFNIGATFQGSGSPDAVTLIQGGAGSGGSTKLTEWKDNGGINSVGYVDINGTHRLGSPLGYTGTLEFSSSGSSNTIKLQPPTSPASPITYVLPAANPTAGQVLGVASFSGGIASLAWQTAGTGSGANTALSNLTATSINQSFVFNAADVYNIGDPTNRVGAIYLKNGLFIYPRGSSSPSPTACGFIPVGAGRSSSESAQFLFYGGRNSIQVGDKSRMRLNTYHCFEIYANLRTDTPANVSDIISLGSSENRQVEIHGTNIGDEMLLFNAPPSQTGNIWRATVAGSAVATLDATGSLLTTGGTRFHAFEWQATAANQTYNVAASDRTLLVDTVNGAQNVVLPSALSNPGMIIDIIHIRAVQAILNLSGAGANYNAAINVKTSGSDQFNGWGAAAQATNFVLSYPGFNGIPAGDTQHKMIKLIADNFYNIWWIFPYYI